MAAAIRRGLRFEGLSSTSPATASRRCGRWAPTDYDAVVLDVMMPGLDGFETCRRLRARGHLGAGADAHRARRGRGPRARPGRGRRRLPDQAVLARRADGAPARAGAPRPGRAPHGARGRRPAPRSSHPRGRGAGRREIELSAARVRAARDVHAPPRPGVHARRSCSSRPGISATSSARTSSRSTSATCARRSTGRSGCSSIETVRGAGYRLRKDGGQ